MIDREHARVIALAEVTARGLGTGVSAVCRLSEVSRVPALYGGPDLDNCWIVYAARRFQGLGPSTIVVIDIVTGAVCYAGSAHDEG